MSVWRRGRVACCAWAPLLLLASCACWEALAAPAPPVSAPARKGYCERADPAWRAYLAPLAFEGRVQSVSAEGGERFATLQVRRVLRQQGHWPRRDTVLRLQLAPPPGGCVGRFEVQEPLRNRRNYIVFAERRGHVTVALGPPLKRSRKLLRRIAAVYKPGYSRAARVQAMRSVTLAPGARVRLECVASARPPPRVTWYRNHQPIVDTPRRIRVHHYRRKSVLEIRHARRTDSARYECRALGAVGPPAIAAANISIAPAHHAPTDDTTTWGAPCPMPDPDVYCLNGGTCLFFEQVREPACKCPEGFNGQRCENKDVSNRSNMDDSSVWRK